MIGRDFALPAGTDHHVKAGLRSIGLADLGELIGAGIVEGVDPEPVAEVGDLEHDRLLVERVIAGTVDDILIGAGHERLSGIHVVRQHGG